MDRAETWAGQNGTFVLHIGYSLLATLLNNITWTVSGNDHHFLRMSALGSRSKHVHPVFEVICKVIIIIIIIFNFII